ncbi:MAG TPA: YkvA family protein [Thermodesulfovibrionales bacterium]|nr:YkvA family protein [Thermodesulfovibrionales bacterium]
MMKRRWKEWVAERKKDTYALYLASRKPRVPLAAKIIAVLVVAYVLSPADLIPDFIPVLGYLDDMVLVPIGIAVAIRFIPADIWQECRSQACDRLSSSLPRSRTAVYVIAAVWVIASVLLILFALGLSARS